MFNPIVGIIHNTKKSRWHPVIFVEHPLPGPPDQNKPVRHKSKAHHTEGFPSREEALNQASGMAKKLEPEAIGTVSLALEKDFEWDGEGIPAVIVFFAVQNGKATPMF
jgi:hypothetical protein